MIELRDSDRIKHDAIITSTRRKLVFPKSHQSHHARKYRWNWRPSSNFFASWFMTRVVCVLLGVWLGVVALTVLVTTNSGDPWTFGTTGLQRELEGVDNPGVQHPPVSPSSLDCGHKGGHDAETVHMANHEASDNKGSRHPHA
eukprot:4761941-Amphidinium_carterae.3